MKKVILSLGFVFVMLSCYSQDGPFKGFFGPVEKSLYKVRDLDTGKDIVPNFWLFRPLVSLSAMQFMLKSPVQVSSFSSLGTGISYSHFTERNGEPYNDYGFNILVLFTDNIGDIEPVKLSIAGSVSLWQYINVGIGYSNSEKSLFLLTAISYNFN